MITTLVLAIGLTCQIDLLPVERNVINETNAQRLARHLPPLEVSAELMRRAREHAAWMTSRGVMKHSQITNGGENIAMGQRSSGEVMQGWMGSRGHRANILNPQYKYIGVGVYRGKNGRPYWCQQFGFKEQQ